MSDAARTPALIAPEIPDDRRDEIALSDQRVALSWRDLDARLGPATRVLRESVGDGRLAVFAENSAEALFAYAAGLLAGVPVVPVNFHFTAAELEYIVDDCDIRVLLVGPGTVHVALDALHGRDDVRVIGWRTASTPVESWEAALETESRAVPDPDARPQPNIVYTGGTTGFPRGVAIDPRRYADGDTVAEYARSLSAQRVPRLGRHLVVGPIYHTGPLAAYRYLVGGAPVHVLERFDAAEVLRAMTDLEVATSIMVPTHFIRLLALDDETRAGFDPAQLRHVRLTGAVCPPEVIERMTAWWGEVIDIVYGFTEMGFVAQLPAVESLVRPGAVGRVESTVDVMVLDDDNREVPVGDVGRLVFRDKRGLGFSYTGRSAAGSATYPGDPAGTVNSGDLGFIDRDGYMYVTDRQSELIVSGGVNIYPAEIERVLLLHPAVADVAVLGMPHPEMGERVVAVVIPREPAVSAEELATHCRVHLAGYKCPREFIFTDDMGRNAAGKVNKRRLRETIESGALRPWDGGAGNATEQRATA